MVLQWSQARRAERSLVVLNKRCATQYGSIGEPTLRDRAIFPYDCVALSLVYRKYTAFSAPYPAKKWPLSMDIRIVLTGPSCVHPQPILRLWKLFFIGLPGGSLSDLGDRCEGKLVCTQRA